MLDIKPVFYVVGVLLCILSLAMGMTALVDVLHDDKDWKTFASAGFFTLFVGISLVLTHQGNNLTTLSLKQTFLMTTLIWLTLVAFSALPFVFSHLQMSYTDAFFEAMSGLTTTGATVITGLDDLPVGLLLWRSLLQWLGGIGIIVMAMAVLPILKIGGMQLFRSESSDNTEKALPRAQQVAGALTVIYTGLTLICMLALWLAGMSAFDAFCHAMTTIATSGFSTHDASIGYFDSPVIETVIILFMIASGIPFVLYLQFVRGQPVKLFQDSQVRWFISMIVLAVTCVVCWLHYTQSIPWLEALRLAGFNVVSVVTTTGFSSTDYSTWGTGAVTFLFLFAVVGGCTGSTTGGIKIFRYQVLYQTAKAQINQLVQPHGIFQPMYNQRPIAETATASVLSFFILFALCFSVLAVLLAFTGLDFLTSMSAAASAMANLGPGLGDIIGPGGNYQSLSDTAKWLLSVGMLVGRLEIFTVLILFSPYFWKS